MADYSYNLASVHGIRRFLWAAMKANNIPSAETMAKYGTLVPIVSVQETAELIKEIEVINNPPYIIYNWTTDSAGDDWWMEHDQIVFLIYSPNKDEIRKIVNFINDIFKRKDQSAEAVNRFIAKAPDGSDLRRFYYHSISVNSSGAALPMETEGGRSEAMVSISVSYTQDDAIETDGDTPRFEESFRDLPF